MLVIDFTRISLRRKHVSVTCGIILLVYNLYSYIIRYRSYSDGSYTLIPIIENHLFNYSLSSHLYVAVRENVIRKAFINFRHQAQVCNPYNPQILPSAYALKINDRLYQIKYTLVFTPEALSNLPYVPQRNRYIRWVPKKPDELKIPVSLLPIPHGQIFEHHHEKYLTLAIRHAQHSNLYIARLKDRHLIRLKYEPLGIDQLHHQRWGFFSDKHTKFLLAVTNIQPHVIVAINEHTGTVKDHARSSQSHLFSSMKGHQLFTGSAPIFLPDKELYLAVFHTNFYINLFYAFSAKYPHGIEYITLKPPILARSNSIPITEIRLRNGRIHTLEHGSILLAKLFDQMQRRCRKETKWQGAISLQWFPSIIPLTGDEFPRLFNPTILQLPKGSRFPYLAAGRSSVETGRNIIIHPSSGKNMIPLSWSFLVICLMDSYFSCVHTPREIPLYFPIKGIVQQLGLTSATPHNFVGPEDPRFIWTETRAPLLLYGMNALDYAKTKKNMTARTVWLVDARHVFKQLSLVLPEYYTKVPFYTGERGVQLNYGSELWEKNWMLFLRQAHMIIGYSVEPKVTIEKESILYNNDSMRWFFRAIAVSQQKIQQLHQQERYEKLFEIHTHNERLHLDFIHQGPNALLIFANQSKFYITILHQRIILHEKNKDFESGFKMKHYVHYTALFDEKPPYRWIAVSKQPIDPIFSVQPTASRRSRKYIFVTTITFIDQEDIENGYGSLYSRILVAYGLYDFRSYVWIGTVFELTRNMIKLS